SSRALPFSQPPRCPPPRPSFPTRRSSDLLAGLALRLVHRSLYLARFAADHRRCTLAGGAVDHLQYGEFGVGARLAVVHPEVVGEDRKSTRLNSSHVNISYAVFCLKKKSVV